VPAELVKVCETIKQYRENKIPTRRADKDGFIYFLSAFPDRLEIFKLREPEVGRSMDLQTWEVKGSYARQLKAGLIDPLILVAESARPKPLEPRYSPFDRYGLAD
jgi:hypothetical protein